MAITYNLSIGVTKHWQGLGDTLAPPLFLCHTSIQVQVVGTLGREAAGIEQPSCLALAAGSWQGGIRCLRLDQFLYPYRCALVAKPIGFASGMLRHCVEFSDVGCGICDDRRSHWNCLTVMSNNGRMESSRRRQRCRSR